VNLPFKLLEGIGTTVDIPAEISNGYVRQNHLRPNIRLHNLSVWGKPKDMPIALIGGGPSVKNHINDIKNFFGPTMACGSPHDYLVKEGVKLTYAALCDSDRIVANYLTKPCGHTLYLVATQCHPEVFERLKYYPTAIFHCYNGNFDELLDIDQDFKAVGGGCTIGLRALSIAIGMGYRDIHFFGFDSCLGTEDLHHAYDFTDPREEIGRIFEVSLENGSDKVYRCAGYHMAQAKNFVDIYQHYQNEINPVFHGEGLLPDIARAMVKQRQLNIVKECENVSDIG
jgi:Protein of unknown function DUF115